MWKPHIVNIFCDICIKEIDNRGKPKSHFTKEAWKSLVETFDGETGRAYEYNKIKNKWDQLKKDYLLWRALLGTDTGLGWDSDKRTIDASNDWWKRMIVVREYYNKYIYKELCMTSYQTGYRWVIELIEGNPTRSFNSFRMHKDVLLRLVHDLESLYGLQSSRNMNPLEIVAIFFAHNWSMKGILTQNVMIACDFDMRFTFCWAGWEGSAHDTRIFYATLRDPTLNFPHPPDGNLYNP
ncbi:Myb_DNA-bind_3 domain-containing protein/DDE_4 domain-containing protein [Cephalotus follicularis]|uniref:Myb_DNA-bind_3 domain-containing protein/DDE_4 domain-containing protein n=1 Tax=Cephalotus follicularis TaxID=3775 RepID=A0A1Q3BZS0_CEPFO|nr:Myb_DNA-bind_3 domain-containing protein/DDE_4 domain-containing protein [Cephalotus follicularis]